MRIRIIGAGAAGLTAAFAVHELAQSLGRDIALEVVDKNPGPGQGCSFYAGGMIAPWCEAESTEPIVATLGAEALDFWLTKIPVAERRGSLVVAPARDRAELLHFSRKTSHFEKISRERLGELEPFLAETFDGGLFFEQEAHLAPRLATARLAEILAEKSNIVFHYGVDAEALPKNCDAVIDARGYAAKTELTGLRGVKGEMMVIRAPDLPLSRPVRMLHPRHPVYLVPRPDGTIMVGATMIENEERARVTARSIMELVNSAFALHPGFAEAEILETGSDLRPSFSDNLPRILREGKTLYLNGLYRHGFLLSPPLASRAARVLLEDAYFPEVMDEHRGQWSFARRERA